MGLKHLFTAAAVSILLAACGAKGVPFTGMTPPADGLGKIYVYRPAALKGSGVHYSVYAGNNFIGHLRNGGYIMAELPPGKHEIWAQTEVRRGVTVPLNANEIQCVRSTVGFGVLAGRPNFETVPKEWCQAEISGTALSF